MINSRTWLLLRGLTREAEHWGSFIDQLQAAFPQDKFYALDLPGAGQFYQQSCPGTIQAICKQIRKTADDNGWLKSKVNLLALSLGGMIAWEWLQQHPDEIAGAVLINSSLAKLSPFYQRLRWQCYLKLWSIMTERDAYQRELNIIQLISNTPAHYETLANVWGDIQKLRPVSVSNALHQLLAAARYRPRLIKPIAPIIVLNSLGDRLVAPICSATIAHSFSLPMASHPWAGHDVCIDDPNWIIQQIQIMLQRPSFLLDITTLDKQ